YQGSNSIHKAVTEGLFASQVVKELPETCQDLAGRILNRIEAPQHVLPTDRFGLEVFEVAKHAGQGLSDPIVKLARPQAAKVLLRFVGALGSLPHTIAGVMAHSGNHWRRCHLNLPPSELSTLPLSR